MVRIKWVCKQKVLWIIRRYSKHFKITGSCYCKTFINWLTSLEGGHSLICISICCEWKEEMYVGTSLKLSKLDHLRNDTMHIGRGLLILCLTSAWPKEGLEPYSAFSRINIFSFLLNVWYCFQDFGLPRGLFWHIQRSLMEELPHRD